MNINTTSDNVTEALLQLVAESAADSAATSPVVLTHTLVTNAAGTAISPCTGAVVPEYGRDVQLAPSPPPPGLPPFAPPSTPRFLSSGLDVFQFVNATNPASAAVGFLLQRAATTVQTTAAIAIGTSVGASMAASALGGTAGGGTSPAALGGAQRNYMYSMLAGPPTSCDDPAASSNGGGWTMARLGLSHHPCSESGEGSTYFEYSVVQDWVFAGSVETFDKTALKGNVASYISMPISSVAVAVAPASVRATMTVSPIFTRPEADRIRDSLARLTFNATSASGVLGATVISGDSPSVSSALPATPLTRFVTYSVQQAFIQRMFVASLVDTLASVVLIVGGMVGLHALILLMWKHLVNRRYYKWTTGRFTRIVKIRKQAGQCIGVGVAGKIGNLPRVKHVRHGSPVSHLLQPGDHIHLTNGRYVPAMSLPDLFERANMLYLLVSGAMPDSGGMMDAATEDQLRGALKPFFDEEDKDNSGELSANEMRQMCRSLTSDVDPEDNKLDHLLRVLEAVEIRLTRTQLMTALQSADKNLNGEVDLEEFVAAIKVMHASKTATCISRTGQSHKWRRASHATLAITKMKLRRELRVMPANLAGKHSRTNTMGFRPGSPNERRVVPENSVERPGAVHMADEVRASIVSPAKLPMQLRRRYALSWKKLIRVPHFRSLPEALMWHNPEVLLLSMFSTALVMCATSVIGATASGLAITMRNLVLAVLVIAVVFGFYVHEMCRMLTFLRCHEAACWNKAERPANKATRQGFNPLTQGLLLTLSCRSGLRRKSTIRSLQCSPMF